MSVLIVKPKIKDASMIDSAELVTAELVDEFAKLSGKLAKKQDKIAPLVKAVAAMEKGILAAVDEVLDPSQPVNLVGDENELQVGAQGQRTSITNMALAVDLLGEELFLKLAKITMKDLQAYLTPEQLEQVTEKKYATKRRVKIAKL